MYIFKVGGTVYKIAPLGVTTEGNSVIPDKNGECRIRIFIVFIGYNSLTVLSDSVFKDYLLFTTSI